MQKIKVLFVCVHNSARSQMAEALLNAAFGDGFLAQSAGLEPGGLNPYAVKVMAEVGIDISDKKTKAVFDFVKKGSMFSYVITVCDAAGAERCPIFSGFTRRLHWSFPDPSAIKGTAEEKMQGTRGIRDLIDAHIREWVKTLD